MKQLSSIEKKEFKSHYGWLKSGKVLKQCVAYMRAAPIAYSTPARKVESDGSAGSQFTQEYRSDGEWFWSAESADVAAEKKKYPAIEFAEYVRQQGVPPTSLTDEQKVAVQTVLGR